MPIRTAADLGKLIRAERLRQHLTQAQLAARHGTTQRWISLVEGGKDATQLGPVLRLLRTLGIVLEPRAESAQSSTLDDILAAHSSRRSPRSSHKGPRRGR
jgi:HTH-type transcriptional regulator/antitoxin HipB